MNTPHLEIVHFQLTLACNLRCPFCGQRHTAAHSSANWEALLDELHDYAPGCTIVLWGGEPLFYPEFDTLSSRARKMGFHLQLITNGTMIHLHTDALRRDFDEIFISIDGPEEIHDSIRGQGVFAKVKDNLEMLRGGNAKLTIMGVLTPQNMAYASEVPYGLPVDKAILHELIAFSEQEKKMFPEAANWPANPPEYTTLLEATITKLKNCSFPIPVEFQPHSSGRQLCREPYRHLHIRVDGETGFCTDFVHESLGNIQNASIRQIFEGEAAEKFRLKGKTLFCSKCSWNNSDKSILKFSTN